MNRNQLEHLIRAAGAVCGESELIILGSQALLGSVSNPPDPCVQSMEMDTYPRHAPEKAVVIDGTIGELSPFHESFHYYAHGVGPETAILPRDWESRLIPVNNDNTKGVTGWCLHPVDLVISKLLAGREKDVEFVRAVFDAGIVDPKSVEQRIPDLPSNRASQVRDALQSALR